MNCQATALRALPALPGACIGLTCSIGTASAVTPDLSAHGRGCSSQGLCDSPYRATGRNAARDLFAFLQPQCCGSPAARCWRDSAIESQYPIDAALVPSLERSGNVSHTLTALPPLPELSLLLRREPDP